LTFANTQLQEGNWADALWHAMGREKFCTVTYKTNEGPVKKRMWAADVYSNVSADIGLPWAFKTEDEEKVTRKIEEAITEITHDLPKISGGEASFESTQQLQCKVIQVLDCIIAKTHLVDRQRNGQEGTEWLERLKTRDLGYKMTGQPMDYWNLPWDCSHAEDYDEILKLIRKELGASETRRAVIHSIGFLCFDDEGEDATRTLSWMLTGLADVVFQQERPVLRKCQWCGRYFFHKSRKLKKFCSDLCRYDSYNKRHRGEER
jgi:hypothetical protein